MKKAIAEDLAALVRHLGTLYTDAVVVKAETFVNPGAPDTEEGLSWSVDFYCGGRYCRIDTEAELRQAVATFLGSFDLLPPLQGVKA